MVPGSLIKQLQPLDADMNKPFNDLPHSEYEWLVAKDRKLTPTISGKRASP